MINSDHLFDKLLSILDPIIDLILLNNLCMLVQIMPIHLGQLPFELIFLFLDELQIVSHEFVYIPQLLVIPRAARHLVFAHGMR